MHDFLVLLLIGLSLWIIALLVADEIRGWADILRGKK
jgi:hypothetical protein